MQRILNFLKENKKISIFLIFMFLIAISIIILVIFYSSNKNEEVVEEKIVSIETEVEEEKNEEIKIIVDIKGMVNNPGVYSIEENYRINDLIALAGGLKKGANTRYINLSKKMLDQEVIIIYSESEIEEMKEKELIKEELPVLKESSLIIKPDLEENTQKTLLNINTASLEELTSLDGIGEAKAQKIIEYRKANNGFKSIDELLEVSGIGESIFVKIKENITI